MGLRAYISWEPANQSLRRFTLLGHKDVSIRRRVRRIGSVLSLCAVITATSAFGQPPSQGATTLRVLGNVESKLTLGVTELQRLEVHRIEDVRQIRMAGSSGKDGEQTRSYTGVLLRDVITSAKPVEKERHDLRRSIVIATATDGYQAVFSWAELFLTPVGEGAMVIFERDGAPLPATEGPLALISLRDTQPGPRHVKWLEKLEIRRIGD